MRRSRRQSRARALTGAVIALQLAVPAMAQTAPPATQPPSSSPVVNMLFEQARMWRERSRYDLAEQSLRKIIESQPDNLEAMLQLGLLDLQRQDLEKARATIARMRQINPADPRAEELERTMVLGQPDQASLAEARRFGALHQFDRAVAAYQRAFRGNQPPYDLAPEYYETLAGSSIGWEESRLRLKALAERPYASPHVRFIYARVLTYNEVARREGIAKLAELAADPSYGQQAVEQMRQAMLWLNITPADRPFFQSYLQRFPADTAVRDKLAELSRPVARDPLGDALAEAYRLADAKQLDLAAARFDAILKSNPQNPDALAGLGIVRLRQDRFEDARDLLGKAMALAPQRQGDWTPALEAANFWATYREALAARDRGDLAGAEKTARLLVAHAGQDEGLIQGFLGEVLRRQNRPKDAETAFRAALSRDPRNQEALVGLYQVMQAQGRDPRGEPLLAALDPETQARMRSDGARQAGERLRAEAKAADRAGSPRTETLYQQAISANPGDPWVRYDFAGYLARTGQDARAQGVVEDLAASRHAESLFAAAVYYSDRQRPTEALALLDRIPANQRSARMTKLRDDLASAGQTEALVAAAKAGDVAARQTLLARANAPNAAPGQAAAAALALAQAGDRPQAIAIVRRLAARNDLPPSVLRTLYYAAMEAGADPDAASLLARLERNSSGADLASLKESAAIRQADRLREGKNPAGAFDALAPYVSGGAPSIPARLALARVYNDARYTAEAMQVLEGVMATWPVALDTLQEAVNIAGNLRQFDRAQAWLSAAMAAQPDSAQLYLIQARLLRQKGDVSGARRALDTAQELNLRGRRSDVISSDGTRVVDTAPEFASNRIVGGEAEDVISDFWRRVNDGADDLEEPVPTGGYGRPTLPVLRRPGSDPVFAVAPTPRGNAMEQPQTATSRITYSARTQPVAQGYAPPPAIPPAPSAPMTAPPMGVARPPVGPPPAASMPSVAQVPLRRPGGVYAAPEAPPAAPTVVGNDPLSWEIQREYATLKADQSKFIQGGFQFRGRSGESGFGRLSDLSVPMRARLPIGEAAITASVQPVSLDAGNVGGSPGTLGRFGTNQLQPPAAQQDPGNQSDAGVAVGVGFEWGNLRGDIGTSPIGFTRTNIVGGGSWDIPLGDNLRLKLEGSRRPVTDSILSYAGTRDPVTGKDWGAVTRTGGEAILSYDDGDIGMYAKGAYGIYRGKNVANNTSYEMTAGAYFRPYKTDASELRIGVSGTYLSYDKNLGEFTFGHGGYFSPQSFYSLSFPADWSERVGKLTYSVGGTIGIQNVQKDRAPYFPGNSGFQAAADLISTTDATRPSNYPGSTETSLAFALRAGFEYAVSDRFTVGGRVNFESSKEYDQGIVMLYVRYPFF